MKKIKKLRKKRIISLILLVCLITITLTFAIYRESISKLLNLNIIHPSYTVTFDANGGSVSTASKTVTYKHQYGELPTPTRDEYQFKGWSNLPSNYQQVEYIKGTGTQYIDTGYYWKNEDTEIYFDGNITENNSFKSLFGNEEYIESSGNSRYFTGIPHINSSGAFLFYLGTSSVTSLNYSIGTRFSLDIKTDKNKNFKLYKDGLLVANSNYGGSVLTKQNAYISSGVSTNVGHIFIFSNHNSYRGTTNAASQVSNGVELYSFKIYDGGKIVRNFIPCYDKNDSTKVGLYDIVNNKFYDNDGTGVFEKGNDVFINDYSKIDSTSEVVQAQDHTLTAIWEENPYTVTFDANGGTVSKSSKKVKDGYEYGTLPTPTRDGYTFKGWNGKNMLDLSNVVKIWNGILNNDGSITANLNNNYYVEIDCSLNLNDYILNNLGKSLTFSMNESIDNRHMGLVIYGTRTGGKTYQETSRLSSKSATITIADDFTSVSKLELRFNREINPFTDTTTTRSNFMLEESNVETPYEPYYITSSTEVVQAQDHTLKAIWEPNTYIVSFNKNDNSASGSMSNISMTYDVSSTLPSNSFTRTGYKFVGWNTKTDGSGTTYSDGASVSNLTTTNNATVTLYAQWQRVNASNVYYSEPEVNCNDVQCMIDELYDMLY